MADQIQNLITKPTPGEALGEEALGTAALLGSTYLSGLRSRAGRTWGPLGQLVGGGLLGAGLYGNQNREEQAQRQKVADILAGAVPEANEAGPPEPKSKTLSALVGAGVDPSAALGDIKDLYPSGDKSVDYWFNSKDPTQEKVLPKGSPQPAPGWVTSSGLGAIKPHNTPSPWVIQNVPGVAPYEINRDTGATRPIQGAPTRPMAAGININMSKPVGPGDILRDDSGKPIGVLEADKTGNLTLHQTPVGVPTLSPKPKSSGKPWTAKDASGLVDSVQKQAITDLTTSGFFGETKKPNGIDVRKLTVHRLLMLGYDENGMPLEDGTRKTDPVTGKTLTWRAP